MPHKYFCAHSFLSQVCYLLRIAHNSPVFLHPHITMEEQDIVDLSHDSGDERELLGKFYIASFTVFSCMILF